MNSSITSTLSLPLLPLSGAAPFARTAGVVTSATAQGLYTIKTDDGSVAQAKSLSGNIVAGTRIWLVAAPDPYILPQTTEPSESLADSYVSIVDSKNLRVLVDSLRQALAMDTVTPQLLDVLKSALENERDAVNVKTGIMKLIDIAQKKIAENPLSPDAKIAVVALLSALEKIPSIASGTLKIPMSPNVVVPVSGIYLVETPADLVQLLQELKMDPQQIPDFVQQVSVRLPAIARIANDGAVATLILQSEKNAAQLLLTESAMSWTGALTADDIMAIVQQEKVIPQKRTDLLAQLAMQYPLLPGKTADTSTAQVVRQIASMVLSTDLSARTAALLDPSKGTVSLMQDIISLSEQCSHDPFSSAVNEYLRLSSASGESAADPKVLARFLGMNLERDAHYQKESVPSLKKELLLLFPEKQQSVAQTPTQLTASSALQNPEVAASARAIAQTLIEAKLLVTGTNSAPSFESVRRIVTAAREDISALVKDLDARAESAPGTLRTSLSEVNVQTQDVLDVHMSIPEKQGDSAQRARLCFTAALKALEACETILAEPKNDTTKDIPRREIIAKLLHEAAKHLANIDTLESLVVPRTTGTLVEKALSQLENLQLAARATTTAEGQQSILMVPIMVDGRWTELRVTVQKKKNQKQKNGSGNKVSIRIDTQLEQTGNVSAQLEYQEKYPLLVKVIAEDTKLRAALHTSENEFRNLMREKGFGNLTVHISGEQKHQKPLSLPSAPAGLVDVSG